ncbi:hypothetical protein H4R35_007058, partial [Dimargaris xerosporica]
TVDTGTNVDKSNDDADNSKQGSRLLNLAPETLDNIIFAELRSSLGLPALQGSPTFVGLHTLLEGGQYELLIVTNDFISYIELRDVDDIVTVIEALFAVFNSSDSLDNFRVIAEQASHEQQGSPDPDVNDQAPVAAVLAQPRVHKALIYRFWVEVIGGNNINQLRYYLCNLLAFDVILKIINQMLGSGRNDDALELAQRLSQLPGVIQVINAFPANVPSYFEVFILRVTLEQSAGFEDLPHTAQIAGSVDVALLYKCF